MSEKVNEKVSEKKQPISRLSKLYEVDEQKGTVKLKNHKCARCGSIMAFHKNPVERWTCGSCSFTDFVKPNQNS